MSAHKPSDVRIETAEVTFCNEHLAVPLRLSKGTISEITYAEVTIGLSTRRGNRVYGTGAILLSDLWAFPHPTLDHATKDRAMRALCTTLAKQLPTDDEYSDPLQKFHWLEATLTQAVATVEDEEGWKPGTLPRLAALNCLSPFDAAIHDGWGRAIGAPVYELYTSEWLNWDIATHFRAYLDNGTARALAGRYPGHYLTARRTRLPIQHVVGVGDALISHPSELPASTALPADLTAWVQRDGLRTFKIKTKGQEPMADAQRIRDVYAAVRAAQPAAPIHLSVDPNEGCPDAAFLLQMLDALAHDAPDAYAALDYIEQPTHRDLDGYTFTLHDVAARKPVILDESFDSFAVLPKLVEQGWTGLAVKTCKGQSASLLAYCWAKQYGYHVTIQDLTNPGRALLHSANLCAHLALSFDAFECNSRQYMPNARAHEQAAHPAYFRAVEGTLVLPVESRPGLY